jgi:protein-tyrosine phosphatase
MHASTLRIAFVCSGNICRSPMAESLAEKRLDDRGISAVTLSAGTLGLQGRQAARQAQLAMEEVGHDISDHRSQGVSVGLLRHADAIVVMAPKHARKLEDDAPGLTDDIVHLWDWADAQIQGISDPVGEDIETFRACRDLIDTALAAWLDDFLSDHATPRD